MIATTRPSTTFSKSQAPKHLPSPKGSFDYAETSRSEVSTPLRMTASLFDKVWTKEKCPICHRRYDRWGTLGQVNSVSNPDLVSPDDFRLLCGHMFLPQHPG